MKKLVKDGITRSTLINVKWNSETLWKNSLKKKYNAWLYAMFIICLKSHISTFKSHTHIKYEYTFSIWVQRAEDDFQSKIEV